MARDTTYGDAGQYSHDLLSGAVKVIFDINGANGGDGDAYHEFGDSDFSDHNEEDGSGGRGQTVEFSASASDVPDSMDVYVGGHGEDGDGEAEQGGSGGFNGGASGDGDGQENGHVGTGGGGGASDVRPAGGGLGDRFGVGGGGGGGGAAASDEGNDVEAGDGGSAGLPEGEKGGCADGPTQVDCSAGYGGTQDSGGSDGGFGADSGSEGSGGGGRADAFSTSTAVGGGGGGGGLYGGGGGSRDTGSDNERGGGGGAGGGSSYIPDFGYETDTSTSFGNYVTITELETPSKITGVTTVYRGATEVELDWDADEDSEWYNVYRDGTKIGETGSTGYVDSDAEEHTTYDYEIEGENTEADGEKSDPETVTTGGAPSGTSAELEDDDSVRLGSDEPVGDYNELRVYRREESEDDDEFELIDAEEDAADYDYLDEGLTDGIEYVYDFTPEYREGESSASRETELIPLPAPTDLEVLSVQSDEADIEFVDNADNKDGYRLYVREDDDGDWVQNREITETEPAGETVETSYVDLLNGQHYGATVSVFTDDEEVFYEEEPDVLVVDDYEHGSFEHYEDDDGEFEFDDTGAQHGDLWLRTTTSGFSDVWSMDGLDAYPEPGDEFVVYGYTGDGGASTSYTGIAWGAEEVGDFDEYFRVLPDDDEIELQLEGDGNTESISNDYETWYRYRVQWDDGETFDGDAGDITAYLEDMDGTVLGEITGSTSAAAGGVGVFATDYGGVDYWRITNRSE